MSHSHWPIGYNSVVSFLKGLGTDDKTLVRVMVSRCEVDMVEIKSVFERTYGKTLDSFIKVSQCWYMYSV